MRYWFAAALAAVAATPAAAQDDARYRLVGLGDAAGFFVDTATLRRSGSVANAWLVVVYDENSDNLLQKMNAEFHCDRRTEKDIYLVTIKRDGRNMTHNVVESETPIPPGTAQEGMANYVCDGTVDPILASINPMTEERLRTFPKTISLLAQKVRSPEK